VNCSSLEKSIKYLQYLPNHVFNIQHLTRGNILEGLNVSCSELYYYYLNVNFKDFGAGTAAAGLLSCRASQNYLQIRKMKVCDRDTHTHTHTHLHKDEKCLGFFPSS
jgi:hypothetical protein